MRIVSGDWRGRALASPPGLTTRPTSDRARQAVFNILMHAGWLGGEAVAGAPVLDLFAGTGAMGLEALSRGAQDAVFIDRDRAALAACRQNIENFGAADRARIITGDATVAGRLPVGLAPRRLVFLDPPYGHDLGAAALTAYDAAGWIAAGAVIVMEMAKKKPEPPVAGFTVQDTRDYGVARVVFMTKD